MELQQEFVSTVSPNIGTLELEPVSGPAVTPVRQHTDTTPPVSTVPTDPSMGSPAASAQPTVELMSGASCAEASPSLDSMSVSTAPSAVTTSVTPSVETAPVPAPHPYGTRLQHNIWQPKVHTDDTVTYFVIKTSSEPTSYSAAIEDPLWRQAMSDEFQSLLKNKTWQLIPARVGLNVIDCK
jgi:hypothetical protein